MISDYELKSVFEINTIGATTFTRRMAVNMADWFNISVRELVQRLERAQLLKSGTWDWFVANGGITAKHIQQVREERT